MNTLHVKSRFDYGRVMISEPVVELARGQRLDVLGCLDRHLAGDWGDLPGSNRELNDAALTCGGILVSRFVISASLTLVILTHQQGRLTKLMLLDEFLENDVD
jgi:hypothetical protein